LSDGGLGGPRNEMGNDPRRWKLTKKLLIQVVSRGVETQFHPPKLSKRTKAAAGTSGLGPGSGRKKF